MIPVCFEDRVVASLEISSSHHDQFPAIARTAIEAFAAQIGGVIARIRAEEEALLLNDKLEQLDQKRTAQLEKVLQDNLRIQEAQIETLLQSDRMKDTFLSVISHELRTPLNAIIGFASILSDLIPGPLTPTQATYLTKILYQSDRMLELVNNILDMARMQAGKFEILAEAADYPGLIHAALDSISPLYQEKGIAIEVAIDVPRPVFLDPSRIMQVLVNLLSNAVKFTPNKGQIHIRAFHEGDRLVTEIQDSGIGISPNDLSKLFAPFQQVDMSSTRVYGGTGLGLSICKAIIELHGGTILAESPGSGRGATFRFILPAELQE
jgi:signal transduction histidine kinase